MQIVHSSIHPLCQKIVSNVGRMRHCLAYTELTGEGGGGGYVPLTPYWPWQLNSPSHSQPPSAPWGLPIPQPLWGMHENRSPHPMAFSLMGHILTHDCLHMNTDCDTLLHLAIMYVNKMDKKWQYAAKEDQQAGLRMNFPCVGSLQVVGDALRRSRAWIFCGFVILHRLLMLQHATAQQIHVPCS